MFRLLAAVVLFCLVSATANARQVALVVGIARYDRVAPLTNPGRDAAAMADRLRDQGFEVIEAFDADRFSMERARRRFLSEARGADLALFYFAGHGIQLFDRNVMLVRDADPSVAASIEQLGLDLNALMADLRAAGPVRTALLIDACRDNPLGFEETVSLLRRLEPVVAGSGEQGTRGVARPATRGLSVVALPAKGAGAAETLAFFAAQPGRVSFDGNGQNSFYVEGLLEAFAQPDRPLTEILRSASAYVRTVTNGEQVPQLVSDWTSDVVLGRAEGATIRYFNTTRSGGDTPLTPEETRIVGEAARAYPALSGTFIVKESQSFTGDWLAASEADRERAKAIGSANGFAIDYDIDRDGRPETIAAYVRQTNVIVEVVDEGVSRLDTPCYDFENQQIGAMEIALRDINGDRRPEIFIHYQTEVGNWGNFCILEYAGDSRLATSRRAAQGASSAGSGLFRTLLRHDGVWTVAIGADNSLELCAGSNCHTRSAYTFDGTRFRMTLDQSDTPKPGKARPFRDHAEHELNQKADLAPERTGAARQPAPRAAEPPQSSPSAPDLDIFTRFVGDVYLPSGSDGRIDRLGYEPSVLYYGKPVSRAAVLADKRRYIARWPRRAYRLDPSTVTASANPSGGYDVTFEYVFEVTDGKRTSAGRGRTRLTVRQSAAGFSILREEGEVIRRP
jgi:hypothetical protein